MNDSDHPMTPEEFAELSGAMPDAPHNPTPAYGGYMDNGGFAWTTQQDDFPFSAESFEGEVGIDEMNCPECGHPSLEFPRNQRLHCGNCGSNFYDAESRFDKLANKIAAQYEEKGMSPEEAMKIGKGTAAKVGREKYGPKRFARMGKAGMKKAKAAEHTPPKGPPYVFPSRKAYPYNNLYHAKKALEMAQWTEKGREALPTVKRKVFARYPQLREWWNEHHPKNKVAAADTVGSPSPNFDAGITEQGGPSAEPTNSNFSAEMLDGVPVSSEPSWNGKATCSCGGEMEYFSLSGNVRRCPHCGYEERWGMDERYTGSAESLVEFPDWLPAGDGRALGQQNLGINLSPLHAEDEEGEHEYEWTDTYCDECGREARYNQIGMSCNCGGVIQELMTCNKCGNTDWGGDVGGKVPQNTWCYGAESFSAEDEDACGECGTTDEKDFYDLDNYGDCEGRCGERICREHRKKALKASMHYVCDECAEEYYSHPELSEMGFYDAESYNADGGWQDDECGECGTPMRYKIHTTVEFEGGGGCDACGVAVCHNCFHDCSGAETFEASRFNRPDGSYEVKQIGIGSRTYMEYTCPKCGSKHPEGQLVREEEVHYFCPDCDYEYGDYSAETFEAYSDSVTERQGWMIQKLGGRVTKSMSRSQASDYIKRLQGKSPSSWSAETYDEIMGPTIEADEGGLHSPSSFDISWEDGSGYSSASIPPNEIHFAEAHEAEIEAVTEDVAVVHNINNELVGVVEVDDDKDDNEFVEISVQDNVGTEVGSHLMDDDPEHLYSMVAENRTSWGKVFLGAAAVVFGGSLLANKAGWIGEAENFANDEIIEEDVIVPEEAIDVEPDLVTDPDTGDLLAGDYEEMVVQSTGYAVSIIPMGLDGSFMGSRFQALPTDRFVDYNEPGIGAHTDVAMYRDTNFREPQQILTKDPDFAHTFNADEDCKCENVLTKLWNKVSGKECSCKAAETDTFESQAPGQSPYFQMAKEPKDIKYRVIKEVSPKGLDPAAVTYLPTNWVGQTGQAYVPPSLYGTMFDIGVAGLNPPFVAPNVPNTGANRLGDRQAQPDTLQKVIGPLSADMNASYTDSSGNTMTLAQWGMESHVEQISDTAAQVVSHTSGVRKMVRRV